MRDFTANLLKITQKKPKYKQVFELNKNNKIARHNSILDNGAFFVALTQFVFDGKANTHKQLNTTHIGNTPSHRGSPRTK